jgi:SAM-dependent methyltransferase
MREGTLRGERKRESVSAMAWLLSEALLPLAPPRPTIVDAGCGTGSLLLPLAALITDATFVGVDTKRGSLDRMMARAAAAGPELVGRVVPWHGRIEDYDGDLQCVISLHACGGASDAALQLAAQRRVPFAVSPCCIGKLRRGPASRWLRELLELAEPEAAAAEATFALLAAWADSEHVAAAAPAPSVARRGAASDVPAAEAAVAAHLIATAHTVVAARRQRAKTLVELDRLAALGEGEGRQEPTGPAAAPGRLLRIEGAAMRTSGQAEVIAGPVATSLCL